ncbi:uncharacterized protein G2W53_010579 [Senna tora]|uniref:Uncharacterized protein n=1 Tax=Senna tora TaxID=362788 RepID=A0A834X116_9FABA|nr:uncharacterized protein G2W53_010579 [Senna tora]
MKRDINEDKEESNSTKPDRIRHQDSINAGKITKTIEDLISRLIHTHQPADKAMDLIRGGPEPYHPADGYVSAG